MEIGSLDSSYINNVLDNAGNATDSIKNKLNSAKASGAGASDQELMEVCKEFEAYFMEQLFKNMKSSMVPSNEESSGAMATLKGYYEDEMMKEYAKSAAEQSNTGLAQMLYEQMKRNYRTVEIPAETTPAVSTEAAQTEPEASSELSEEAISAAGSISATAAADE